MWIGVPCLSWILHFGSHAHGVCVKCFLVEYHHSNIILEDIISFMWIGIPCLSWILHFWVTWVLLYLMFHKNLVYSHYMTRYIFRIIYARGDLSGWRGKGKDLVLSTKCQVYFMQQGIYQEHVPVKLPPYASVTVVCSTASISVGYIMPLEGYLKFAQSSTHVILFASMWQCI